MSLIRLDKFLAEMQIGTRSEVKKLIRGGKVQIDGHVCKNADEKIDPEQAEVMVDHVLVGYAAYEYFMLNKPQGVVSATEDALYPTVLSLIHDSQRKDGLFHLWL